MRAASMMWTTTVGKLLGAFALSALFTVGSTGCNPNSIGRPCINAAASGGNVDVLGTQVASPALECPSRLCLIQPNNGTSGDANSRNTCTASCESDDDCDAETKEYCKSGFRCAVATQVGRFCCRKFCVCQDDLVPGFNVMGDAPDQTIITPHACDPLGDAIITCPNVTTK